MSTSWRRALAVVAAIAVLVALYLAPLNKAPSRHEYGQAKARADVMMIVEKVHCYVLAEGELPSGLECLLQRAAPSGATLLDTLPVDPWGRLYRYCLADNGLFCVLSLGRDGKLGGEGEDVDVVMPSD